MACGAADDFVTDFGPVFSVFFVDPDGLEGEVLVANRDAAPDTVNPPGTRAARFSSRTSLEVFSAVPGWRQPHRTWCGSAALLDWIMTRP